MNKLIPLFVFPILFLAFLGTNQEAEAASMTFTTDTTINSDMTIAAGETWTINPGVTLEIASFVTVTVDLGGTIENLGDLITDGTGSMIRNGGIINNHDTLRIRSFTSITNESTGVINNFNLLSIQSAGTLQNDGILNHICEGFQSTASGVITGSGEINFLPCPPEPEESQVVGGEIISIDVTSLILAGTQSFSWMIPVLLSGIGIGLFVLRKK